MFAPDQRVAFAPSYLNGESVPAVVVAAVETPPFPDVPLWRVTLPDGARAVRLEGFHGRPDSVFPAIAPGGEAVALACDLSPVTPS